MFTRVTLTVALLPTPRMLLSAFVYRIMHKNTPLIFTKVAHGPRKKQLIDFGGIITLR